MARTFACVYLSIDVSIYRNLSVDPIYPFFYMVNFRNCKVPSHTHHTYSFHRHPQTRNPASGRSWTSKSFALSPNEAFFRINAGDNWGVLSKL